MEIDDNYILFIKELKKEHENFKKNIDEILIKYQDSKMFDYEYVRWSANMKALKSSSDEAIKVMNEFIYSLITYDIKKSLVEKD